jgi:transcriptional regulator with XRE-family HTH domain/mannose-6-phosphate isomerase-like protein (cupin superfamily)
VPVPAEPGAPEPRAGGVADRRSESVGRRLRTERERQRIGLRELARRVNVSASLISQVELGKATPSVGTLYSIVNELGMSLDELFFDPDSAPKAVVVETGGLPNGGSQLGALLDGDASHPPARALDPVVRSGERKAIQLDSGVRWERLTPVSEHDTDFLYVIYEPGGASCPEDALMRHAGKEYGHVLEGRLDVTVGFDTYELGPGDSISFDSTMPHRLYNPGDEPAEGIWFIIGRRDDARLTRRKAP